MSERVSTGIDGLDGLIEGSFLRGDVILVAGGTGSKTIFSTQFIYNGATQYGEKGVYATFEEDAKEARQDNMCCSSSNQQSLEVRHFQQSSIPHI